MRLLFFIITLSVFFQAFSFTYVKCFKVAAAQSELLELEDMPEESDSSEEDITDINGHCPFWEPFFESKMYFSLFGNNHWPDNESLVGTVQSVECPPPRA